MKKDLLVSFSGGETSGYMAQWLKKNKSNEYNLIFVFANTGLENEETLEFVDKCDKAFNLNLVWVEAKIYHNKRKGTSYNVVDFKTASRNGEPFEEMIKKYGIPNRAYPHCTRETKLAPIREYAKNHFKSKEYYTAIGIRIDEIDRISVKRIEYKLIYPLIEKDMIPMTKAKINFWWNNQDFRLNLKGYQGNCKTCWKKSDKKLHQIAKENPSSFDFMINMEDKYSRVGYEFTKRVGAKDRVFFRGNKTGKQVLIEAKESKDLKIIDDSQVYEVQTNIFENNESCDVFSNCGDK